MKKNSQQEQPVERRRPTQERARCTQLLIFETAAKVLEEEGLEGFNTNRIAALSGYSIGTIYQYFPNKQAIIQALAQHEQDKTLAEIERSLLSRAVKKQDDNTTPDARIRAVVRAVLRAFGGRQRARRILVGLAQQSGRQDVLDRPVVSLAGLLTSGVPAGSAESTAIVLSPTDAFVLTQAVVGVIRAALARDEKMLKLPELEDALVSLVQSFMQARLAAASQAVSSRSGVAERSLSSWKISR